MIDGFLPPIKRSWLFVVVIRDADRTTDASSNDVSVCERAKLTCFVLKMEEKSEQEQFLIRLNQRTQCTRGESLILFLMAMTCYNGGKASDRAMKLILCFVSSCTRIGTETLEMTFVSIDILIIVHCVRASGENTKRN